MVTSILIYSKFSQPSNLLYNEFINKKSLVESSSIHTETLCIDNYQVRETILKNKKIDVKIVPSILLIYDNGIIEKYDGDKAFTWWENLINTLMLSKPEYNNLTPVSSSEQTSEKPLEKHQETQKLPEISPINSDSVNSESMDSKSIQSKSMHSEPIQPLDEFTSTLEDRNKIIPMDIDKLNHEKTLPKKSPRTEKQSDLVRMANDMQKEREKLDSTIKQNK